VRPVVDDPDHRVIARCELYLDGFERFPMRRADLVAVVSVDQNVVTFPHYEGIAASLL